MAELAELKQRSKPSKDGDLLAAGRSTGAVKPCWDVYCCMMLFCSSSSKSRVVVLVIEGLQL